MNQLSAFSVAMLCVSLQRSNNFSSNSTHTESNSPPGRAVLPSQCLSRIWWRNLNSFHPLWSPLLGTCFRGRWVGRRIYSAGNSWVSWVASPSRGRQPTIPNSSDPQRGVSIHFYYKVRIVLLLHDVDGSFLILKHENSLVELLHCTLYEETLFDSCCSLQEEDFLLTLLALLQ